MFLGHYAVALAAKRVAPKASLGTLVAAAQLLDLLWPIFLLLGWETVAPGDHGFTALRFTSYPWSHSLAMTLVWAGLMGTGYFLFRRDRRTALVLTALVVSHWVLDYVTHLPDLPLWPGSATRVGLGLWRYPAATVLVEGALTVIGAGLYLQGTRARDRVGSWGFVALAALLVLGYAVSLVGGGPPADMRPVAWGALAAWLVPFWAAWVDRHRAQMGGTARDTARAAVT